jgi:biotin carboxyl carrier protein
LILGEKDEVVDVSAYQGGAAAAPAAAPVAEVSTVSIGPNDCTRGERFSSGRADDQGNSYAQTRADDGRRHHCQCLVKVGDKVNKGDVLFEVETDKATLEADSPFDGSSRRF